MDGMDGSEERMDERRKRKETRERKIGSVRRREQSESESQCHNLTIGECLLSLFLFLSHSLLLFDTG